MNNCIVSDDKLRVTGMLYCTAYFFTKCPASNGTSSRRSRSGGRSMRDDDSGARAGPRGTVRRPPPVRDRGSSPPRGARRRARRGVPPRRENSPSCSTRSSRSTAAGRPIVADFVEEHRAWLANSNLPGLSAASRRRMRRARTPNSSHSRRSAGSAVQFTLTNGLSRRSDDAWSARATRSLPVPRSPRIEHRRRRCRPRARSRLLHVRHRRRLSEQR